MGSRFTQAASDDDFVTTGGNDLAASASSVIDIDVSPLSASQVITLYLYGVEFAVFSMVLGYGQAAPCTNIEHAFSTAVRKNDHVSVKI